MVGSAPDHVRPQAAAVVVLLVEAGEPSGVKPARWRAVGAVRCEVAVAELSVG